MSHGQDASAADRLLTLTLSPFEGEREQKARTESSGPVDTTGRILSAFSRYRSLAPISAARRRGFMHDNFAETLALRL